MNELGNEVEYKFGSLVHYRKQTVYSISGSGCLDIFGILNEVWEYYVAFSALSTISKWHHPVKDDEFVENEISKFSRNLL